MMNRRALLKSSLPLLAAGLNHNLNAAAPKFSQTKLKKNVVLVTSDFGLYNGAYQEGKHECSNCHRMFRINLITYV